MIRKPFLAVFLCSTLVSMGISPQCYGQISPELEQAKSAIFSLIDSNNLAGADAAVEKMIADFPGRAGVDEALVQIIDKYRSVKQNQRAIDLGGRVIADRPNSKQAVWAQMHIVMANLDLGNEAAAGSEVNSLSGRFGTDPNAPWALYLIGEQYRWSSKYQNAKELYQRIVQQYPASPYAEKARLAIARADILSLVASGSYNQAQDATNKLLTDFASHPDTPETLCDTAQQCSWMRKYDEAQKLYQQVLERYPNSPVAARAQKCVSKTNQVRNNIFTLIEAGNCKEAMSNVDKLIADFGDEPDVPAMVYHIASELEGWGRYGEAGEVYQQLIWRYAGDSQAENAKLDVQRMAVLTLLELSRDSDADAALAGLVDDFNDHPHLPTAIVFTAEGYMRRANRLDSAGQREQAGKYLRRAVEIFELVIRRFPNCQEVPNAYCLAGDCLHNLGEYQRATDYYQRAVDGYPQFTSAWRALLMIGRNYEDLRNAGQISRMEAAAAIKTAYQRLTRQYPDCEGAKIAGRWLRENGF